MKIYASLTTIPSRIEFVDKAIASLVSQTRHIDTIFLNVPNTYKRFPGKVIPDSKLEMLSAKYGSQLCINKLDEDYGPGTKLLGVPRRIFDEDAILVLIDDDVTYKNDGIEIMVRRIEEDMSKNDSKRLYSFFIQHANGIDIAQGVDMMCMHTEPLKHIHRFFDTIVRDNISVFLNDDMWISFYFARKGYEITKVPRTDGEGVYTELTRVDALAWLQGDMNRWILIRDGSKLLFEAYHGKKLDFINTNE